MDDMVDTRPPHRSRRILVVVAAVAVVAVVGFVVAYKVFFSGSSAKRLTLSQPSGGTSTSVVGAAADADPVGQWSATTGSVAGYRVREKLASLPAESDAVGRSTVVTGGMTVGRSGSGFLARDMHVDVDLTQLKSDEARRDNRIRTQGLETTRFPTATFVSTKDLTVPADAASGKAFNTDVEGNLTLHGVTKPVKIPVQAQLGAGGLEVVGSMQFPMSMFDITPPSVGGFVSVQSNATLEFKVVMKKA